MAVSSGQTFIGSKISLISRAGIRYEGILYSIDSVNSTVALSKVKSFGTEDRYSERTIPPKDDIYEYIIFRGNDIQDLHVCEPPTNEMQLISQDPAIIEITGKPPVKSQSKERKVKFSNRHVTDSVQSDYDSDYSHATSGDDYPHSFKSRRSPLRPLIERRSNYVRRPWGRYRHRGRGTFSNYGSNRPPISTNFRGSYRMNSPKRTPYYSEDYDFESANAEIAKELERLSLHKSDNNSVEQDDNDVSMNQKGGDGDAQKEKLFRGDSVEPTTHHAGDSSGFYNKGKSFFDMISTEVNSSHKSFKLNTTWRDEQRLNAQTFGDEQPPYFRSNNRFFRGGRRYFNFDQSSTERYRDNYVPFRIKRSARFYY